MCSTNPNFPLDMLLFKLVEKNKLSKYFWASFWDSHIFEQIEKFTVNFPKNASKQQKSIVLLYVGHFEEKKKVYVSICPLLLVWSETVV